ncbi:diacylglycerol O-acyltransferase [Mycobacterium asiaticum]|uniref:Diacylglycerol O-acyltransferase n=1 Tax=Mycobacterium asiaticum TaxID=1790 RepID=A0A1A3PBH4_MYCAS|nr:wax ester/triacylglycerol synthase family O-acyltransferase [Mycobacterium asiaticum]OBK30644.1 diacylglycerol O-acyltransferase [Mycobacterium asiaticum]
MDQLTTLDAGFLKAEDVDSRVSLAIGGLAVVEGPAPQQEALVAAFGQRIRSCPRFGQRLRLHPLDLGAPEWVDDPDFDIERHVRRAALPQPGDERELYALIADVMARRLDRDRPLWEVWVIEGLAEDRWAMLTKLHHCMADGIAATHVLAGLCDDGIRGNSFAHHVQKAHASKKGADSANQSRGLLGGLWAASAALTAGIIQAAHGAGEIAAGLMNPGGSSLNGPLSDLRRYSGARVAMSDIEQISKSFDVTVNDVALAAITESYRNVMIERGLKPLRDSLRTLVPVSVRSADAFETADNRVSLLLPNLPVDEENPVQRLRTVHDRLNRAKSSGQRQAGNVFVSLANRVPFALSAWTVGLLMRLPQRGVATVATNVPGPRLPLRVLGKQIVGLYPVPPLAMDLRTGVAMLSYADDLFFGILTDYDVVVDADKLARGIEAAVARLVKISERRQNPPRRGPLSLVV